MIVFSVRRIPEYRTARRRPRADLGRPRGGRATPTGAEGMARRRRSEDEVAFRQQGQIEPAASAAASRSLAFRQAESGWAPRGSAAPPTPGRPDVRGHAQGGDGPRSGEGAPNPDRSSTSRSLDRRDLRASCSRRRARRSWIPALETATATSLSRPRCYPLFGSIAGSESLLRRVRRRLTRRPRWMAEGPRARTPIAPFRKGRREPDGDDPRRRRASLAHGRGRPSRRGARSARPASRTASRRGHSARLI